MNLKTNLAALFIAITTFGLISPTPTAADSSTVPAIILNGFKAWGAKADASYAFDIWKKDGVLEYDNKPSKLSGYFKSMDRTIGNFKSYEIIQTKHIGDSSEVIYLTANFDHAAVYGRFLLYHADKDWVVQNMDFSVRPELVMPWLAFQAGNDSQE
jgi:hypothetical protein